MNYSKLNLIYFSATNTTREVLHILIKGIAHTELREFNITNGASKEETFKKDELTIIGVPVYAGRVPKPVLNSAKLFKSMGGPAIVVCVFGNRDFDDALLELHDIATGNGFKVIAAGAFIAQHSIFPKVAHGRPDDADKILIANFGKKIAEKLQTTDDIESLPEISVEGNFPYRLPGSVPLRPRTRRSCNACGACARQCPTGAIDPDHPRRTDKEKCIACARCITICPKHARHFGGILYHLVARKFGKMYGDRQEPYVVY